MPLMPYDFASSGGSRESPLARVSPALGLDMDVFPDFVDSLADLIPAIERDVGRLRKTPEDRALLADLFRAVHNLKGDSALCRFQIGVRLAHPIESLLARLREGSIPFSEALAEVILLALDRLELAVDAILAGKSVEGLLLPELADGLQALTGVSPDATAGAALDLIERTTGFRPASMGAPSTVPAVGGAVRIPRSEVHVAEDLRFFRTLALQLEARSPLFKGRTGRLLRLAQETNQAAGRPVDPIQLEAAVYMHDVGMMLLPESAWLKVGRLTPEETQALRQHPGYGSGLLARMEGWDDAAAMVAQHHETPTGRGYPEGCKEGSIHPGAQILALADAFEAVTLKQSDRGQTRSALRAIAEVNACDDQFSRRFIGPFNLVIRKLLER